MSKLEESLAGYYSRSQIAKLKKELIASIEKEDNVEVLRQCADLLQMEGTVYDEAYFAKQDEDYEYLRGTDMPCSFTEEELDEEVKSSEKSGWADDNEVRAFITRWTNLK